VTGLYAVGALGYVARVRYQLTTYSLQPGVDAKREQAGMMAMKEGSDRLDENNLPAAQRSYQAAELIWEELTRSAGTPAHYRQNLAISLSNLGWISAQQNRPDEAESYMNRGLVIAEGLAGQGLPEESLEPDVVKVRGYLAEIRARKLFGELAEKDKAASAKYEEGVIKADKHEPGADLLFREAIALWEEVLSRAKNPEHTKHAESVLADGYAALGENLLGNQKIREAESAYRKSLDHQSKAAALSPDRPLIQHELGRARQRVDFVDDLALQREFDDLLKVERYADARDALLRGIEQQEKRLSNDKERALANNLLAARLSQLANFLVHCPSEGVRDTKEAVKLSRRATQLAPNSNRYWFVYALTLYRIGDWSNSVAALDQVKAKQGDLQATDFFLLAMNQYQLKRPEDAKASLGKGINRWEELVREAEDNAELRVKIEGMRPTMEALKQEAQELLKGKNRT
jgi:hypothetical protein